jgi:hypothetical protein
MSWGILAMNAIASNFEKTSVEDAIAWHPNLDRLRREAELARMGHAVDPWSVVEAECWLDLIEAELSAKAIRSDPKARAQLVVWRTELARLRTQLKASTSGATHVSDPRSEKGASSLGAFISGPQPHGSAHTSHHQPVYGGRTNEVSAVA